MLSQLAGHGGDVMCIVDPKAKISRKDSVLGGEVRDSLGGDVVTGAGGSEIGLGADKW